jgi:hypothetical protein
MLRRKLFVGAALSVGALTALAGPAAAHECFNPNKPAGAGVNYTITGFGPDGPIFVQTGPGKGIGGFATVFGFDVHTLGNSSKELVGGPGSQTADHACDGKGIDYLEACAP